MSRITRRAVLDGTALAQVLLPRDGVVLERPVGDGTFEAAEGPVDAYERTVSTTDQGHDRYEIEQTVDFELALPWFGWVFLPLVRPYMGALTPPTRLPWWAPPQRLEARASTALATVMGLSVVTGYVLYLLTQTMTYAADDFDVGSTGQGVGFAVARADLLLALPLLLMADRRGRRLALMLSTSGACVLNAVTALAPTMAAYVGIQVPARACATASLLLIGIVAAEEMPAGSRAWSLGLLTMAGSIGGATCLTLLFLAQVASWRLLYVVAIGGLFLVRGVGRRLAESRRFRAPHASVGMRGHGRRLWLLAGSALLLNLFSVPGSQFQNEFLKEELGYSAVKISVFIATTTILGAVSIAVGGRLADTRGRRAVAAVAIAGGALTTVLMFNSVGWPVWLWSTLQSLVGLAVIPALGVYGPEMFPTSLRGWANGIVTGTGRVGSVIGLVVAGVLADRLDRIGPALTVLSIGPLLVTLLILVAYPETASVELEDLNPEDRVG